MRYRGAFAQRNRMDEAWEIPLPGAQTLTPTAIHAHCLLLYFLHSFYWKRRLYVRLLLPVCCFHLHIYCSYALRHITHPARRSGSVSPHVRQNGICNRKFGAAPFRCTHGISLNVNPTITECSKPWERACLGHPDTMPTAFHAHCLLLILYSFCIPSRASNLPFECFLDCGESYRTNMSKLRVEARMSMSLSAHAGMPPHRREQPRAQ